MCVLPLTREWIEIHTKALCEMFRAVLPLTREWIEIQRCRNEHYSGFVLPLTREWIEISLFKLCTAPLRFSLLRGSGLKCKNNDETTDNCRSPSYEGVD